MFGRHLGFHSRNSAIYLAAVLSTSVYGGNDGCQFTGTLPLDPVVIVSLAFSSLGLLFNAYLALTTLP